MAMLAHLLQIVAGWLGAVIILLVRRDSRFVTFHALQVLLLHVAYLVVLIILGLGGFFLFILFTMTPQSHVPSPFPVLFVPLFMLTWVGPWMAIVVMGIVYGIKANQGEWAEYPVVGAFARKILKLGPGGVPVL